MLRTCFAHASFKFFRDGHFKQKKRMFLSFLALSTFHMYLPNSTKMAENIINIFQNCYVRRESGQTMPITNEAYVCHNSTICRSFLVHFFHSLRLKGSFFRLETVVAKGVLGNTINTPST